LRRLRYGRAAHELGSRLQVAPLPADAPRPKKFHGQSIWLTRRYLNEPQKSFKQHILLHEFCHFVGPGENRPGLLDDVAYLQDERFRFLGKLERLHNASTLSLFFQEWRRGHVNVSSIRFLRNPMHFNKFPRVNGATGEIEVAK
jgi:hypothetical protein